MFCEQCPSLAKRTMTNHHVGVTAGSSIINIIGISYFVFVNTFMNNALNTV